MSAREARRTTGERILMLVAKLLLVLTHASLASCWILQFRPTQAEESVHRMTLLPRAASIRVMADSLGDVEPAMMRAAEIKAELKERQIDFSDCFDKESLADKLDKARAGLIGPTPPPPPASSPAPPPTVAAPEPSTDHVDPESFRAEVMAMRASQIKAELQERRILFTDCFDKESLADKLCQARAGLISPIPEPPPPDPPRPRGAARGTGYGAQTRQGEDDNMSMEEAFKAAGWTGDEGKDPSKVDQARSPGLNRNFGDIDRDSFRKPWSGRDR